MQIPDSEQRDSHRSNIKSGLFISITVAHMSSKWPLFCPSYNFSTTLLLLYSHISFGQPFYCPKPVG